MHSVHPRLFQTDAPKAEFYQLQAAVYIRKLTAVFITIKLLLLLMYVEGKTWIGFGGNHIHIFSNN